MQTGDRLHAVHTAVQQRGSALLEGDFHTSFSLSPGG